MPTKSPLKQKRNASRKRKDRRDSRAVALYNPANHGIYSKHLSHTDEVIYRETLAQYGTEELETTDITGELVLARVSLAALLNDPEVTSKQRLQAIERVSRIAGMAEKLKEMDNNAIRTEFLEAVMTAISFAFHRANGLADPADRAKTFVDELATFFPAVDGQGVPMPPIVVEGDGDGNAGLGQEGSRDGGDGERGQDDPDHSEGLGDQEGDGEVGVSSAGGDQDPSGGTPTAETGSDEWEGLE